MSFRILLITTHLIPFIHDILDVHIIYMLHKKLLCVTQKICCVNKKIFHKQLRHTTKLSES